MTRHSFIPLALRKLTLRIALIAATFILSIATTTTAAHAQRVNPMAFELAPSGSDSTEILRVENTSQTKMTIELSAFKINIDKSGKETRIPADDDFLIFPPQAIIASGKVQNIRVKYIGDPAITQSSAYRVKVSQVPVDITGEQQSAVGLVINFHTLATVSPKNAKVDLQVRSITESSNARWDMVVENTGNKMARLSRTKWDVSDGKTSKKLNAQKVSDMTDTNLIMPGAKMTLSIPAIEGVNPATAKITIHDQS